MKITSYFVVLAAFLLCVSSAAAVTNDAIAYYSCDNSTVTGGISGTMDDLSDNNTDMTMSNVTANINGILGESCGFRHDSNNLDAHDFMYRNAGGGFLGGRGVFTVNMWVNFSDVGGLVQFKTLWSTLSSNEGSNSQTMSVANNEPRFYTKWSVAGSTDPTQDAANDNQWYFYTFKWDGGEGCIFRDGVKLACDGSDTGKQVAADYDFTVGSYAYNTQPGHYGFYGQIDEISVYDRNITGAEMLALYNGGAGYNPYDTPQPSVTLNSPADDDHDNDATPTFNFDLDVPTSCGGGVGANMTLWINESGPWFAHGNASFVNTLNGTDRNITVSYINETSFDWKLEATSGQCSNTNSSERTLVVDLTNPVINRNAGEGDVAADNSTVWNPLLNGDSINASFNATDTYMFAMNVTATLANGTKIYSNQTTGMTGTVGYDTSLYNLTTKPIQATNITYNITASDDHTAHEWDLGEDTIVQTTSNSVTFTTPEGVTCTVEASEANLNSIEVIKEVDRYRWVWTKNAKTDHALDLKCPGQTMFYRGDLYQFPSWVVEGTNGYNWIDLNVGDAVYSLNSHANDHHTVTITLPEASDTLDFSSIGGLNIVSRLFSAEITLWPNNPVRTESPNESVSWVSQNWTVGTGASFYAVYRDGVNVANTSALFYNHTGLSGGTSYSLMVHSVFNLSDTLYENMTAAPTVTGTTIFNGTLSAEVRNEVTNSLLSGVTVFITLLGSGGQNISGNTTTGTLGIVNISTDNYTVRHSAQGWGSRDQYLEIGENDSGSIVLYLLNDSVRSPGTVDVNRYDGSPSPGQTVILERWYGDEVGYRTVQMARTGSFGLAVMTAQALEATYQFIVQNGSQETVYTSSQPEILSLDNGVSWYKTIVLGGAPTDTRSVLSGWNYSFSPENGTIANGSTSFSFAIDSDYWNMSSCAFRLLNESNGAVLNGSTAWCAAQTGTATLVLTLINGEDVRAVAEINTTIFSLTFDRFYGVFTVEAHNATLVRAFEDMEDAGSAAGFGNNSRMLIALLIIVGVPLALGSRREVFSNPETLVFLMFALSVLFSYVGWIALDLPGAVGPFNQWGFTILLGVLSVLFGLRRFGVWS